MKKIIEGFGKAVLFFVGWAICIGLIPAPESNIPAIWRFWAEAIPLIIIVLFTLIFWLIEKKTIKIPLIKYPFKSLIIGTAAGLLWIFGAVGIIYFLGGIRFGEGNQISISAIWFLALFLNTIMQELLVRGYLYQMLKSKYNIIAATIVSTGLFVIMHGGAFEAGLIAVFNVLTMSLLMTIVLEYTESLLASVMMHFIWNAVGALILGGISVADDYPHILTMEFMGNPLISGGIYKIEGSCIVFVLNILLIAIFVILKKRRK